MPFGDNFFSFSLSFNLRSRSHLSLSFILDPSLTSLSFFRSQIWVCGVFDAIWFQSQIWVCGVFDAVWFQSQIWVCGLFGVI